MGFAGDGDGEDCSEDEEEATQKRRGWRRARRMLDVPTLAIAAGAMIWLACFLLVDDPFAAVAAATGVRSTAAGGIAPAAGTVQEAGNTSGGAASDDAAAAVLARTARGGMANAGAASAAVARDRAAVDAADSGSEGPAAGVAAGFGGGASSGSAGADARVAHAGGGKGEAGEGSAPGGGGARGSVVGALASGAGVAGGGGARGGAVARDVGAPVGTLLPREAATGNASRVDSARRAWLQRLTGGAMGANASGTWSQRAARLRKRGGERLREKQEELLRKGEQVHSASVALASAISDGRVHPWVVWGVVAAFVACAVALQVLASARGRLRQCVRQVVARSLPVSLAPNELVTRPYASWKELFLRVSLDFLNEPANLMLISIGSLQVLATWSKADPLRCKKINLLVLLLNFAYTIVQEVRAQVLAAKHDATWNSTPCSRLAKGSMVRSEPVLAKDICVGDVVQLGHGDICPATGELVSSSHSFVLFNSLCETGEDCCSVLAVGGAVLRGFVLASEGAEVAVRVTETRNGDGAPAEAAQQSEAALPTSAPSAPPAPRAARPAPSKVRSMERFPEHMNAVLMRANFAALALLFCGAALSSALAWALRAGGPGAAPSLTPLSPGVGVASLEPVSAPPGGDMGGALAGDEGMSQTERLLVTHFFSAAVQLNTVIPSMRWVVLFFLYVFLIEAARPDVRVQNWRAFRGLDRRKIVYSDKTGTLTQVGMHVNRLRLVDAGADATRQSCVGMTPPGPASGGSGSALGGLEWLAVVLLACSDCQPRPFSVGSAGRRASGPEYLGLRPGTSPEEIAIAEYLEDALGLVIESNPLQPGSQPPSPSSFSAPQAAVHTLPLVLYDRATGRELVRVSVLCRGGFDAAAGSREARVQFLSAGGGPAATEAWIVRQGGADVMAELAGRAPREEEMAREDQDRALGWSVARLGADGDREGAWRYVARASFANPPRPASAPMVSYFRRHGLAVRMLTGDASIAALYIARQIHIAPETAEPQHLLCHEPDEAPLRFAARVAARLEEAPKAEPVCVVVPGAVVRRLIELGDGADAWLADVRASAVIFRTRAADKALIVGRTEELGRAQQRRIIAQSRQSKCLPRRRGEDGVCWMIGDAANDAEAISLDDVVGVSLRHGATPCKLGADFVVDEPGALVALRAELHGRALSGARWLLEDVCVLCGLVSSLTLCGVWAGGFRFLPRGFLYDDPFDARIMTLFSGGAYPISACAAACTVAAARRPEEWSPAGSFFGVGRSRPVRHLLAGAAMGTLLGLAGPSDDTARFGRFMLTATFSICIVRHVFCTVSVLAAPFSLSALAVRLQRCLSSAGPVGASGYGIPPAVEGFFAAKGSPHAGARFGATQLGEAGSGSCAARSLAIAGRPRMRLAALAFLLVLVFL